jgi:hypothetical protein
MSTSKEQKRHDDYWKEWDAAMARAGWAEAGPDHPVYQDKSFTMRSARSPRRPRPTSQTGDSPLP